MGAVKIFTSTVIYCPDKKETLQVTDCQNCQHYRGKGVSVIYCRKSHIDNWKKDW